jgi:hypothetical protein
VETKKHVELLLPSDEELSKDFVRILEGTIEPGDFLTSLKSSYRGWADVIGFPVSAWTNGETGHVYRRKSLLFPADKFKAEKAAAAKEQFATGSQRDSRSSKGRFDLLPARALFRLAKHFEGGSQKYGARNWEKGQPLSRYMDSALRHAFKFLGGARDEDHAIAAVWNLLCLVDTEERIKAGLLPAELNDLPPPSRWTQASSLRFLRSSSKPSKKNSQNDPQNSTGLIVKSGLAQESNG